MRTLSQAAPSLSSQFCPSLPENPSTEPQPLSLSHTLLFSYCRRVHLGTKKEAWTQCKGASFQAGQKKLALAECLCLALVKTSIWIREVNEECSVWEDWYMVWSPARRASRQEFTAVWHALWKLECSHTSEFSSGQHLSRGHAGNIFFCNLSFLSLLLAVCFTLGRAESAEDGKLSYFALFWPPHPWLAPVFSSSPCSAAVFFTWWGCSDWPAASVYACFSVGAPANPLLWAVNIQDSIFGWCDWSMRWQSHAFVPWLDDWTFVNYFCQKWSLLCD